jgi:hypothetical protein
MKRFLVPAFVALAVALIAPSAFATRAIFDPPSGIAPPVGTDCTLGTVPLDDYTPCNVNKLNTPYFVRFVDCSSLTGLSPPASGWCLYLTNVTGGPLHTFTFNFTVPTGGSADHSDELTCGSQPPGFATDNCVDGLRVSPGDVLDLSFFASLPSNHNFYLITDFFNSPGVASVTVSVPEPGELGLFGLGLLALGVAFDWKRRQMVRAHGNNAAA